MDTTFLTLGVFLVSLGLLMLLAELFVTSGVMFVLAVGSIIVGLVFLFKYDTHVGLYSLGGTVALLVVGGILLLRMLPSTPLGQMARALPEEEPALPLHLELQQLKGRTGRTKTALRPSGMVDFAGRRVDCITVGMMVEAGRWVRCVEVRGSTVIVRPTDHPETSDLETIQFS